MKSKHNRSSCATADWLTQNNLFFFFAMGVHMVIFIFLQRAWLVSLAANIYSLMQKNMELLLNLKTA